MIDTSKQIKSVSYNGVNIPLQADNTALIALIQRDITTFEIPESVKSIGSSAFDGCRGLTSITIPDSVTSIGNAAFQYCSNLTSITIPEGVTSIEDWTFQYCRKLTSITIGSGVTSIGIWVFEECTALTSITIPNSVTSIKTGAFYGCSKLTEMTILATTPPTLVSVNAISTATTTIYIPAGTLSAYQSATNWSSFASKFVELSE